MRSFLHPHKQSWVGVSPFPLLFLPWKLQKVGRLSGQFGEEKAWSQRGGGGRQTVPGCDRSASLLEPVSGSWERRSQSRRGSACRVCSEGLQTLCFGDRNPSVWRWRQLEVGALRGAELVKTSDFLGLCLMKPSLAYCWVLAKGGCAEQGGYSHCAPEVLVNATASRLDQGDLENWCSDEFLNVSSRNKCKMWNIVTEFHCQLFNEQLIRDKFKYTVYIEEGETP